MASRLRLGGSRLCRTRQGQEGPGDSQRGLFSLFLFIAHFVCFGIISLCFIWILYLHLQRLYKKNAIDCFGKFTLIVDRPEILLAKANADNLSDVCKNQTFEQLEQEELQKW